MERNGPKSAYAHFVWRVTPEPVAFDGHSRAAQMGAVRQILRKRGTRWVMQAVRCVINTGPSRRSAPATNHKLPVTATTRTSWTWISTTLTSTSSRRFPFSTRCGKRPLDTANRRTRAKVAVWIGRKRRRSPSPTPSRPSPAPQILSRPRRNLGMTRSGSQLTYHQYYTIMLA